jgi:hypothetical protein
MGVEPLKDAQSYAGMGIKKGAKPVLFKRLITC